jgi:putative mRNA 3-end processing factor
MEYKGYVSVVSGDYKIQDDGISTPFESVKCNEFVSESTFGLPVYNWLSVEAQEQQMRNWVQQTKLTAKPLYL